MGPAPDSQTVGYAADRERTVAQSHIRMGAGPIVTRALVPSSPAGVRVGRGMEVLTLRGKLLHQALQLRHPAFGRTDGHAILAARVAARLARIQPVLKRSGEQAVCDVPEIGILILVREPIAQIDGFGEGRIKCIGDLAHGVLRLSVIANSIRQNPIGAPSRNPDLGTITPSYSAPSPILQTLGATFV